MPTEPYEKFRNLVSLYPRVDLLLTVAFESLSISEFELDESWHRSPPWALAAIARDSILYGKGDLIGEHQVTPEKLTQMIDLFKVSYDTSPTPVALDTIFSSFQYEQFPYQHAVKRDIARGLLLMQDMPDDPRHKFRPDWKELFGHRLDEIFLATIIIYTAARSSYGSVNRYLAAEPHWNIVPGAIPVGAITDTMHRLSATILEAQRDFSNQKVLDGHLQKNSYNPLVSTPLIDFGGECLVSPVPQLILRSMTADSLYYAGWDNWGAKFTEQLGYKVQTYTGKLFESKTGLGLIHEIEYKVGKDVKHSIDWFLVTDDLLVLIECKSGVMPYKSRAGSEIDRRAKIETTISGAIDQLTTTYNEVLAENSYFDSLPKDKRVIGMVVTMEPLYLANSETCREHLPESPITTISASLGEIELLAALTSDEINRCLLSILNNEDMKLLPLMDVMLKTMKVETLADHPMIRAKIESSFSMLSDYIHSKEVTEVRWYQNPVNHVRAFTSLRYSCESPLVGASPWLGSYHGTVIS